MSAKLYLDTSVISALFDERAPERMRQTKAAWDKLYDYEVYLSNTVLFELNNASADLKNTMLEAVKNFIVLPDTGEASALANEYVSQGIFPDKYRDDAMHVSLASTNGIGILLS